MTTIKMCKENDDWKSIANELVSSLAIIHEKDTNTIEKRALQLIEYIEQQADDDVPKNDLILPLMNALSYYSKQTQTQTLNASSHNDDDDDADDADADFLYVCILEYVSSLFIDENCKIKMIYFINLIVVLSSGSTIEGEGGDDDDDDDDDDDEMSEEKNLERAKLVLYNILMCTSTSTGTSTCTSDDHHQRSFSLNFHALENSKLQNFWGRMEAAQVQAQAQVLPVLSKKKSDDNTSSSSSSTSTSTSSNVNSTSSDTEAIITAGDYAAEKIYSGAKYISKSLTRHILPQVTNGIENLGEYAKQNITPSSSREDFNKSRSEGQEEDQEEEDQGQGVAITQSLVQNSDKFRIASESVATGIRDISTKGINKVAEKWEENSVGKDLCPQNEMRESFVTAGKIGMAAIGATVEIAESMFEVTKAVAQSSVKVTADVAQHKYGGNTKAVIENTGAATGNILRGITHVASLEGQVLSKTVVKNTARVNIEEMVKIKSNDTKDVEDEEIKKTID